jgi:hypothetical protein
MKGSRAREASRTEFLEEFRVFAKVELNAPIQVRVERQSLPAFLETALTPAVAAEP